NDRGIRGFGVSYFDGGHVRSRVGCRQWGGRQCITKKAHAEPAAIRPCRTRRMVANGCLAYRYRVAVEYAGGDLTQQRLNAMATAHFKQRSGQVAARQKDSACNSKKQPCA